MATAHSRIVGVVASSVGSVVKIALRSRTVLGIILAEVLKPDFIVKPIEAVGSNVPLSDETLRLIKWLSVYYPSPLGTIARQFLPPVTSFPLKKH